MKKLIFLFLSLFVIMILIVSCTSSEFPGYKKDSQGLYFKEYISDHDALKPQIGDYLTLTLMYKNANDSVLFNSHDMQDGFKIPCREPGYQGDFYHALSKMHLNDSVSFVLCADSFFIKTIGMNELPPFVSSGDFLYFDARLTNIMPKEKFEKQQQELIKKQQEIRDREKQRELDEIDEYVKNNNIGLKPTESGLYFIEINKGKGKSVTDGNRVKVHYTGVFLDGQKFDSSYDRDKPIEFEVGDKNIIPGWNEGLKMMREGGKAVLIVPSNLAYGEQGRGDIPPYTTLVFEINLLEVND